MGKKTSLGPLIGLIGPFIYFLRIIPVQSILKLSKKTTKKHTPAIKNLFFLFSESTYRHQANIDDEVVTMEILDTAGQVRESILE